MMLHKLRRAMVNAAREPLHGEIEVDYTLLGLGTGRTSTPYRRIQGGRDMLKLSERS